MEECKGFGKMQDRFPMSSFLIWDLDGLTHRFGVVSDAFASLWNSPSLCNRVEESSGSPFAFIDISSHVL